MTDSLFYRLGKNVGPRLRRVQWIWASMSGSQANELKLEYQVGLDLAEEARRQLRGEPDGRSCQMLADIGSRLTAGTADSLRRFHFEVYQAGEPNAFALPGGFVFASSSILALCQDCADDIAFVVAHEISHIVHGHAIERIMAASAISLAHRTVPASGVLGAWLAGAGVRFLETAYSRSQELEADGFAVRLASAAGYDPRAALRLLSRLAPLNRSKDALGLGRYFSSHPDFESRVQNIRRTLALHSL